MILMIDNYDSFTYNLVQMFQSEGEEVRVVRNDRIDLKRWEDEAPSALVVSPGPGVPARAGVSVEAVFRFGQKVPVLGVCLGHQSIAAAFGGRIVRAEKIMHGKTSRVYHDGRSIFAGLPNPFEAVRYHSLVAERKSLPDCLEVSAWTEEGEIMGVRRRQYRIEGVQFHPESILTESGRLIIKNFLGLCHLETGRRPLAPPGLQTVLNQ